jgi:hypothetical protein
MPKPVIAIAIHPPRIASKCCSFVSLAQTLPAPQASRGRDIGGKTRPVLAGSRRREEDRALKK